MYIKKITQAIGHYVLLYWFSRTRTCIF